jgi:hypothetical protein
MVKGPCVGAVQWVLTETSQPALMISRRPRQVDCPNPVWVNLASLNQDGDMTHTLCRCTRLTLAALLLAIGCGCTGMNVEFINTDPAAYLNYNGRMMAPNWADPDFPGNAWSPY